MQGAHGTQDSEKNQLLELLIEYREKEGLTVEQLAAKLGFSKAYLNALFRGVKNIRDLPVSGHRKIASALSLSCLSALLLSGHLKFDDLTGHQ